MATEASSLEESCLREKVFVFPRLTPVIESFLKDAPVDIFTVIQRHSVNGRRCEILHLVAVNMKTFEVHCTCQKIQSLGLPCMHYLRVMHDNPHNKDVPFCPRAIIPARWFKNRDFDFDGSNLLPKYRVLLGLHSITDASPDSFRTLKHYMSRDVTFQSANDNI